MALIEVKRISKSFSEGLFKQTTVLKDINLTVNSGDFIVLRGANGAGKSTLLKIILGLQEPDAGEVKLFGKSPKSSASKLQVGTVFQEVTPPDKLTVREVLDLVRSYYPDAVSTQEILEKFSLVDKQSAFLFNLAGGQKQRLYFALALIGKPKLLVLDEPTKNLDIEGQETFWQEIAKCRDEGVTILMVTHVRSEQDELQNLATHIITVADGNLTYDKQPDRVDDLPTPVPAQSRSANIFNVLLQQTWAEILQLSRQPLYIMGTLLLSGGLAALIPNSLQNKVKVELLLLLIGISAISFILLSVDRLGKKIALERVEGWLKLVKVTPLPPSIYILAKVFITILILLLNFIAIFGIGIFAYGLEISPLTLLKIASALLLAVIPFALLGIALGYIIPPKSVESIAVPVLIASFFSAGIFPVKELSFLQDLFVISPFFHYQQIISFIAQIDNDNQVLLHILWLVFYSIVASAIAQYAYQRDRLSQ